MRVPSPQEQLLIEETGLIRDAQAGDRRAFAALVDRYWEPLYRWLCYLSHDPTTAEDLTQETFLKAFAALESFRPGSHFRAWLFRIGQNNFVNHRREQKRKQFTLPMELTQPGDGPLGELLSREGVTKLVEAIHKLPTDFRAALLLRIEEELSFKEIATILSITEETARWRVFKARQKLMQVLSPELVPSIESLPGASPTSD
ncbi:RNA polymerase sigma factor [Tuwongella immobilis]|nr:RNA polymerase sigma factor [Tuwongella immobilis]